MTYFHPIFKSTQQFIDSLGDQIIRSAKTSYNNLDAEISKLLSQNKELRKKWDDFNQCIQGGHDDLCWDVAYYYQNQIRNNQYLNRAEEAFKRIEDKDAYVYFMIGKTALRNGKVDTAIRYLRLALKVDSKINIESEIKRNLGLALSNKIRIETNKKTFRDLHPEIIQEAYGLLSERQDKIFCLTQIIKYYLSLKKFKKASVYSKDLLKLDPSNDQTKATLAYSLCGEAKNYLRQKKYSAAVHTLHQSLLLINNADTIEETKQLLLKSVIYHDLAEAYAKVDDQKNANKYWKKHEEAKKSINEMEAT